MAASSRFSETFTSPAPQRSVNSPHLAVNSDGTLAVAYEHRTDASGTGHGITGIAAALMPAGAQAFGLTVCPSDLEDTNPFGPAADLTTASGGGHRYVVWDSGFRTPIAFSDLDGGFTPAALPADPATSLAAAPTARAPCRSAGPACRRPTRSRTSSTPRRRTPARSPTRPGASRR